MRFIPTAFAPSTSVGATRPTLLPNRCHVQQRTSLRRPNQKTPTMVSAISLATELVAAGALGFGTYYFFFREESASEATAEEATASSPAAAAASAASAASAAPAAPVEKQPPVKEVPEGIIGLSGSTGSIAKNELSERSFPTPKGPAPVTPPPFDTIGVDINDYLDSADATPTPEKELRLEEELSFAANALSDLSDCHGAVVVDYAGDAVWATGELVGDTVTLGTLPRRVRDNGELETLNVENNMSVPFLKTDVRNIAAMPIGETGGILVLASRRLDFFGEVEKRVADAVCTRLAHFLPTPPSVGA